MKLKTYSREDCKYRYAGSPVFRVEKSGVLKLSKQAYEQIDLKAGEKILILQDQERPTDWYIQKTNNEDGFVLRESSNHLAFNAKNIAIEILKSLGVEFKAMSFQMSTNPIDGKYYAILTKSVKGSKS
nr:hypothetical protein [uncultured Draconibacterium sp.]